MQNKYKELAKKGKINISQCLYIIRKAIANSKKGYIAFGNTLLYNTPTNVTMVGIGSNTAVELYSEDGYEILEDIAHWADIVEDFNNCVAAGNDKYSVVWNIPTTK